jgi:FkbM family methyltransferase
MLIAVAAEAVFEYHEQRRIELTVACRDTDMIPKVPNAGEIVTVGGRRVQVMHNGVVVEADGYYGRWMTEIIRQLRGHHEPQEELAIHAIIPRLPPAPIVVELGSFWAYYALWAHRERPDARVVLVEPDPHNLDVGRRNAVLNRMPATFLRAAVAASDDHARPFACESDGGVRPTDRVSVDGLVAGERLPRIDLLIADVQGAELDMLRGAARALDTGLIRFLVLSTHHHSISGDPLTHQRCLDAMAARGAHIIAEHTVSESCSGDGLIACSFDAADRDVNAPVSHVRARNTLFGEVEYDLANVLADRPQAVA